MPHMEDYAFARYYELLGVEPLTTAWCPFRLPVPLLLPSP